MFCALTLLFSRRSAYLLGLQIALAAPAFTQSIPIPLYEDFETSPGLFIESGINSNWEWGIPNAATISTAGEGELAWVTGLEAEYLPNSDSFLQSAPLDFTRLTTDPTIQFLLALDLSLNDNAFLEMSLDGGPFERVGAAEDPGSVNWYTDAIDQSWNEPSFGLAEWRLTRNTLTGAAGSTAILRWRLVSGSSTFTREGLGIDRVQVFEGLADVGLVSFTVPKSGPAPLAGPLQIEVQNLGTELITSFEIDLQVTGPVETTVTETFSVQLSPLDRAPIQILSPIDTSLEGEYSFAASVRAVGDGVPQNDGLTGQYIHQQVISTFPYIEDFESGAAQFFVGGDSPSWELGLPVAPIIDGPASGLNSWVTNLDGAINFQEQSYLQSVPYDLSGFDQDPFLEFRHRFSQSSFSAGNHVDYSLDGGPFMRLGSENDPGSLNWYNETFSGGGKWENSSPIADGWRLARNIIEGGAGHTVVFRFEFNAGTSTSSGAISQEGVGLDDIRIFAAPFGSGQPSQPNTALLDINNSAEVLGFPTSFGMPGPYFSSVSLSENLSIRVEGLAFSPVAIFVGTPSVGEAFFPLVGQVDIATPISLGSGFAPGGINPFFFTTGSGVFEISLSTPASLIGIPLGFQGLLPGPDGGLLLTNAVQVDFLP